MTEKLGVGIIGCGNISAAYLTLGPLFQGYEILAVADINMDNANARAAEFTVRGQYIATAEGLPEADGQNYDIPAGIFFDVDDGLITRVTTYYNLKDWIAQVS